MNIGRENLRRTACLLAGIMGATEARPQAPGPEATLVVHGGRLFDGTGAPSAPLGAIVVRDGRVSEILPVGAPLPDAGRVIDAEGCTVLPGLFDLHVHIGAPGGVLAAGVLIDPSERLAEDLYCGVTRVLDLHGDESTIFALRDKSRASDALARLYSAGGAFTVPKGHGTQFGIPANEVDSPASVDARMELLLAHHPDVIKAIVEHGDWGGLPAMPTLSPDLLGEIGRQAHEHALPLFVHVWTHDEALLAAQCGARALAHGVFANDVDEALIREMKAHGTAYVATLSVVLASTRALGGARPYDHALAREALHPDLYEALSDPDLAASLQRSPMAKMDKAVEARAFANLRAMLQAGIEIGIGTDAGNPLVPHGVSVPFEIGLNVEAGLTPPQALRAATLGSAHILGIDAEAGSIEPGKVADLVLYRGDPSVAIGDLWNVRDVVKAGVIVDREHVAATNRERARPATTRIAGKDVPPELDGFEDGDLVSSWGGTWTAWSDRVAPQGTSDAHLEVVDTEATKSLRIAGTVTDGFPWGAWAGATLYFDPAQKLVVDASAYHGVRLRLRGTPRPVSVTLQCAAVKDFNVFSTMITPTEAWADVDVPFDQLKQIGYGKAVAWTGTDLKGITIDARNSYGSAAVLGDFHLDIDRISLY